MRTFIVLFLVFFCFRPSLNIFFGNIYPNIYPIVVALRLVHDLADDFLKFSAKGEKKKKEGEKKKKEREKKEKRRRKEKSQ